MILLKKYRVLLVSVAAAALCALSYSYFIGGFDRKLPADLEKMFSGSNMTVHKVYYDLLSTDDPTRIVAMINFVHHFKYNQNSDQSGSKSTYSVDFKLRFPGILRLSGDDAAKYYSALKNEYSERLKTTRTVQSGWKSSPSNQGKSFSFTTAPLLRDAQKHAVPIPSLKTRDLFGAFRIEPTESLPIQPDQHEKYFINSQNIIFSGFYDIEEFKNLALAFEVDYEKVQKSLDPIRSEVFRRLINGRFTQVSTSDLH